MSPVSSFNQYISLYEENNNKKDLHGLSNLFLKFILKLVIEISTKLKMIGVGLLKRSSSFGALHIKLDLMSCNFVQVLGRALCGDEGEQCIFGEALFVPDPVIDVYSPVPYF